MTWSIEMLILKSFTFCITLFVLYGGVKNYMSIGSLLSSNEDEDRTNRKTEVSRSEMQSVRRFGKMS